METEELMRRVKERNEEIDYLINLLTPIQTQINKLKQRQKEDKLLLETDLQELEGKCYTVKNAELMFNNVKALKVVRVFPDFNQVKILEIVESKWSLMYGRDLSINYKNFRNFPIYLHKLEEINKETFDHFFQEAMLDLNIAKEA